MMGIINLDASITVMPAFASNDPTPAAGALDQMKSVTAFDETVGVRSDSFGGNTHEHGIPDA